MTTRSSFLRRALASAGLALPITVAAGDATAQTTGGGLTVGLNPSATITHALPDGTSFTRAATLNPAGVNFEDCERDIVLDYPLVATGSASAASGYALYAFAGTGCDKGGVAVSAGAAGSTCWPVTDGPISYDLTSGGFAVPLRARQILAQYALPVKQAYTEVAASDDSSCHLQPTSAALQIPVYFVFATSADLAQIGGSGVAPLGVDLLAAGPPTLLAVDAGNDGLVAKWSALRDEDVVGYELYYAPPDTSAADAGDAGASACPSTFSPGSNPFVAVSGNTSTSGSFAGLTNGETYAVAIASTDAYGNVGALSDAICQAPNASAPPVATAEGGDGGCSLGGRGGGSSGAMGSALLAAFALVSAVRRRRRSLSDAGAARALRGTRSPGGARCPRPARSP